MQNNDHNESEGLTSKELFEALSMLAAGQDEIRAILTAMNARMVTKGYLDDKIADFRGDLIANDRSLDQKGDLTAKILKEKDLISSGQANEIVRTSPFPKLRTS